MINGSTALLNEGLCIVDVELDHLVGFPTGARLKEIKVLDKTGFSRRQVEPVHL